MSDTSFMSDRKISNVARFLPSDRNDAVTAFESLPYALTQIDRENAVHENHRMTQVERRLSATDVITA